MRAVLRFFFSPSRAKHAGDGLRQRQQFFFGQEFFEELGLMRHRAEPAADVDLEAAPQLAVYLARDGDAAEVVHAAPARRLRRGSRRRRS